MRRRVVEGLRFATRRGFKGWAEPGNAAEGGRDFGLTELPGSRRGRRC